MPYKKSERKDEGRVNYEQIITNMINDCNFHMQNGNITKAYLTLRAIYTQLYDKHREWWLDKIEERYDIVSGVVDKSTAKRMLNPRRPFDHYLSERHHDRWMTIKQAFSDMCKEKNLFFHSKEVEVRNMGR